MIEVVYADQWLYSKLSTDATLISLVGTRIYSYVQILYRESGIAGARPQADARPFMTPAVAKLKHWLFKIVTEAVR